MSDFHPDMSLTKAAQGSKNSLAYGLLIMQNLSKKKLKLPLGSSNESFLPQWNNFLSLRSQNSHKVIFTEY